MMKRILFFSTILCLFLIQPVLAQLDSLSNSSFKMEVHADGTRKYLKDASTDKVLLFSGELWIGGFDQMQNLHFSAQTYKQGSRNYFPGPNSSQYDSIKYNRVWHIKKSQIDSLKAGFYTTLPSVISQWPAHGNTLNGEPFYLAPYVDVNANGYYDPTNGDYPSIKGAEAIYFIYNDVGNGTSNLFGLGVDIHGMAFIMNTGGVQDSILFVDYKIINRSSEDYHDVFIGSWGDMDLGNSINDLAGSHIGYNAAIGYNRSGFDAGSSGFGHEVASLAQFIRKGPPAPYLNGIDDNRDGCIDGIMDAQGNCIMEDSIQGLREFYLMSHSSIYFNRGSSSPGILVDPSFITESYNLISGHCNNGLPLADMIGSGIWNSSNPLYPCDSNGSGSFVYPGNSIDSTGTLTPNSPLNWFMPPNHAGDIRTLISSGPFDLPKGEAVDFNIAFLWHRADSINSALDGGYGQILRKLGRIKGIVRAADIAGGGVNTVVSLPENSTQLNLNIYYDQVLNRYTIDNISDKSIPMTLYSISGKRIKQIIVTGGTKQILDLKQYPKGIYVLRPDEISGNSFKLIH